MNSRITSAQEAFAFVVLSVRVTRLWTIACSSTLKSCTPAEILDGNYEASCAIEIPRRRDTMIKNRDCGTESQGEDQLICCSIYNARKKACGSLVICLLALTSRVMKE